MPCPIECGAQYLKPFLPLHTALVCPLSLVPCPNKHVGCDAILQRRAVPAHTAHECAFRGAAAGLHEVEAQVRQLRNEAAALSAAMLALPSQLEREQEALAQNQVQQLPPALVAQAREWLQGKDWARLSWQRRPAVCISFAQHEGAHVIEQPPASAPAPSPEADKEVSKEEKEEKEEKEKEEEEMLAAPPTLVSIF